MFAPFHPKEKKNGDYWASSASSTVAICYVWHRHWRAGEAGRSLSHLRISILPKTCIWLQKRCTALCPEPSRSAAAGHPCPHRSPAASPAHASQLRVINAAGILRGSISTLRTALNTFKKIQRKCKAMSCTTQLWVLQTLWTEWGHPGIGSGPFSGALNCPLETPPSLSWQYRKPVWIKYLKTDGINTPPASP